MPARVAVAVFAALGLAAPLPAAGPDDEFFETKVRPVLVEHCYSCHGPAKQKGGLRLDGLAAALAGGDAGPAVVPGKPDESLLVTAVRYADDLKMPPKGKLPDAQVAALAEWVKRGAPWPDAGPPTAAPGKKPGGPLFTAEQKAFWAFQPVREPAVPAIRHPPSAIRNPIDAFVRAKLADAGLTPAPPADPRTLIRRVTFDLTGLPPTPEEVDAFLADHSPTAFEKVVDRLLASPHYGERWGRHWLDVARYADSNGLDENTAFANAWKYRDYVVRSFNADKPFDVFVKEQLAGDLLPPTDDPAERADRLTALGYLAVGPKLLAEPDKQKMLLDIADEQLDTVGKGLLGLTLGCARCHDHKFDPIPTRDYYGLLGVFTSTRTMQGLGTVAKTFERSLDGTPPEATAADRKRLDAARREVRKLEQEFGKTPPDDKAKRSEIHQKAEKLRAEVRELEKKAFPADAVLGVEEGTAAAYGTAPRNLYVQVRGNYATPGEEAPAVFLRVIAGERPTEFVSTAPNPADKPQPNKTRFGAARSASGRRELAEWIASPANPLTARVWVNRVWRHHFGEGLVRSPDNFGRLGDRPSHPELLDYLAARFVADGWSTKALHRRIVLSDTYRQGGGGLRIADCGLRIEDHTWAAAVGAAGGLLSNPQSAIRNPQTADPDNRLLAHFPRRRLEAEAIRDAMLATAGTLDRTAGGSLLKTGNFEYVGTESYDSRRRSVYLPVVRNKVFPFFQAFDFPDPSTLCGHRVSTVVAPQALYLMNSPFVAQQSAALAARLLAAEPADDAARVRLAYRLAYAREATADEAAAGASFVGRFAAELAATEPDAAKRRAKAWAGFCQALFASSEFVYVD